MPIAAPPQSTTDLYEQYVPVMILLTLKSFLPTVSTRQREKVIDRKAQIARMNFPVRSLS